MGLVKAVRLGTTQSLSSRRRRDILDLRDTMRHDDLVMIHIDGPTNPVDVGTKRDRTEKAQIILRRITERGRCHPTASADYAQTFGALPAIENIELNFEILPVVNRLAPRGGFG